jgi:S-adenosylmethionine decarboxylase proenzyme
MKGERALHVLIDFGFEQFSDDFENSDFWDKLALRILETGGFEVLDKGFHNFQPQGFTGFWLLSESHFSLHTWPEERHICFDLFSCGEHGKTRSSIELLAEEMEKMGGKVLSRKEIERGYVYKGNL